MTTTLTIDSYQLSLERGRTTARNTIKVFPTANTAKIAHVFLRFEASGNTNTHTVLHLYRETSTRMGFMNLHLGEHEMPNIASFLREERFRFLTFNAESKSSSTFDFNNFEDDGVGRNVDLFEVVGFQFHTEAPRRSKPSNPVLRDDPVLG
jgi:hypothetical protein